MPWLTVVVVRTSRSAYPPPDGLGGSPLGRRTPAAQGQPPMIRSALLRSLASVPRYCLLAAANAARKVCAFCGRGMMRFLVFVDVAMQLIPISALSGCQKFSALRCSRHTAICRRWYQR